MGENERELSIIDILRILLPYKFLIIACVVVFSLGFFVMTAFFTEDEFTSTGVLYVSNHMQGMVSSNYSVELQDIESARIMASTCMELLNTRTYLSYVSDVTGGKYDWEDIAKMISISSVNETELLSISVTSDDPDDSYDICKAIINKAPSQLGTIFTSGTIEIIDEAVYPELPNSKGVIKKTAIGFAIGFMLGVLLAFLLAMFDKQVHIDTDLQSRYDIPMLGNIMNE